MSVNDKQKRQQESKINIKKEKNRGILPVVVCSDFDPPLHHTMKQVDDNQKESKVSNSEE